jgi:hypothetical protein
MKTSPQKIWFPAKTYGWGWGPPVCWQGWVVVGVYLTLMLGGAWSVRTSARAPWFALYAIGLSAGLIAACWLRGERPHWRWGKSKKTKN